MSFIRKFAAAAILPALMCCVAGRPLRAQGSRCEASMGSGNIFHGPYLSINYPEGWEVTASEGSSAMLIAPRGAVGRDGGVSCGVLAGQTDKVPDILDLRRGTTLLLEALVRTNPDLRVVDGRESEMLVGEVPGLMTELASYSGHNRERVSVVIAIADSRVRYLALISPYDEHFLVKTAFLQMLNTVRFYSAELRAPVAVSPARYSASGNELEYKDSALSFRYPRGWQVTRGSDSGAPYTFLAVTPMGGSPEGIYIRYQKYAPNVMCGAVHQEVIGAYLQNSQGGPWQQRPITEEFDAGSVVSTVLTRFDRRPPTNVVATVCSNGHVSSVAYEYDHTRVTSADARLVVMKSLAMGTPDLGGEWTSQGATMAFYENGVVRQWYSSGYDESRGTYQTEGNRLTISWTSIMGVPRKSVSNCTYTLTGAKLTLDCEGERLATYRR